MYVESGRNMLLYFAIFFAVCVSGNPEARARVVVQPSTNGIEVRKNSRLIIDCLITSSYIQDVSFSWTKNGVFLLPQKRVYVALNGSLIIEKFLNKRKKSRDDTGYYECYASNSYGTVIGRQVDVIVTKASLSIQPANINAIVGGVARFRCQIDSASPPTRFCVWEHPQQNSNINRMSRHMGILQLYNLTSIDEGQYTCRYMTGHDSNDVLEKSAFLSVHSGHLPGIPTLLQTPQNLSVVSGQPALLECLVEGGEHVTISWRYSNGTEVRQERGRVKLSGYLNLQFASSIRTDTGSYRCVVTHAHGNITREYHLEIKEPPEFTETPPESSSNVLTAITRLTCKATGNPAPTVQWYKDGLKIYPAPGVQINPQLILYGRLEDTGYYQCIANNSLGINVATVWVVFERQPNTPDIVTNVKATPLSATQVNVTWSPAATPDGYPVMAYFVDYQLVHDLKCPGRCGFQTKSEREVSNPVSKANYLVIDNLMPYTKYRFAVQCLSAKGASSMSNAVTVRTLEAVPTAVPGVQIAPDSSTSFRVLWTEIPEADKHGIISKYQLSYGTLARMITVIELSGDTTDYLVTGLEPDSEYVVKVLAGNSVGFPNIDNNWITHWTPMSHMDEYPVPVLTFEPVNSTSVTIMWTRNDADFVGSYRIVVQKLLESGTVREFNVSADTTRLDVTGLEERLFYKIDFMKRDTKNVVRGYVTELYQSVGPDGDMEPPPPYIINPKSRSSSVISLSWEEPKTSLAITKYTIRYQQRQGDQLIGPAEQIHSYTHYASLRNLQPFTWYAISVQSHTDSADGPYCKPIIVQTNEGIPSPPENLLAEVVSPGTVKLEWGPPKEQNGIITFYIIYYNSNKDVPDGAWSSIQQNASHTSVLLEDLNNNVYYFKLRACTNAGAGLSSHVIMIDTLDCDSCPQCAQTDTCESDGVDPEVSRRKIFEQRLGIIIGCAVGFVCIFICVTFVIFKQREMRSRSQNRPITELVGQSNGRDPDARYLGMVDASRLRNPSTCSPMLRRMLENREYSYKVATEQRALLSPSSTGSVNNQTSTSNTDSCETTPGSCDCDLMYQPIQNCESIDTGLVLEVRDDNSSAANCSDADSEAHSDNNRAEPLNVDDDILNLDIADTTDADIDDKHVLCSPHVQLHLG